MLPPPADWATVVPGLTLVEVIKHYKVGKETYRRWAAETGIHTRGVMRRPWPDNLAEMCETLSIGDLAKHMAWSTAHVSSRLNAEFPHLHVKARANSFVNRREKAALSLPIPEDFKQQCKQLSLVALQSLYAVGRKTLNRWLTESGNQAIIDVANSAKRRSVAASRANNRPRSRLPSPNDIVDGVSISVIDMAMRFLQRFSPCYPMRVKKATLSGYYYQGQVWTDKEILDKAERRGFVAWTDTVNNGLG